MTIIYILVNLSLVYYQTITMGRVHNSFQKGESKNMTF